jgi:tetratricopeptide (TPR) repeat protein
MMGPVAEPFVEVRARSRFMAYGQSPVGGWEAEVWTLRVPAAWVESVPPGASSPELTKRCEQAVRSQADRWRDEAIAAAERSAAQGGDYDAGFAIVEVTAVRRYESWELERGPWTQGHLRFFYVVDDSGSLRRGTDADVPPPTDLTPLQESLFAGWREEQVERWAKAAACYAEALRRADTASEPALLSEVESSLARVNEEIAGTGRATAARRAREAAANHAARVRVDDDGPGPRHARDGYSLMRQSAFPEAIESLRAALAEALPDGGSPVGREETLFSLGVALEHENLLEEAQASLRSALAQFESRRHGLDRPTLMEITLARVLARSGPAHAAEARAILDRTATQMTLKSEAQGHHYWASALVHHAAGDRAEALAAIDRAIALIRFTDFYKRWLTEDRARIAGSA